jgi:uncharacterized pyridoxamine 5'-phosphate oxidase family protein
MKEVYDFLKKCGAYYLGTNEGDQPRVRPFGTVNIFDGKLYIQTGKVKKVSKQIHKNPKIEICGFTEGKWIRVQALALEDERIEARQSMLYAYPSLIGRYAVDDGNMEVFYLKDATATIESFTGEPKEIKF